MDAKAACDQLEYAEAYSLKILRLANMGDGDRILEWRDASLRVA